jgi:hypothetical protein
MKLNSIKMAHWPKLAWVAKAKICDDTVKVFHGPMVEAGPDFCVEAVWADSFESGNFDMTDLVFGSGVRVRDDCVVFVSSGTTTDRLWYTSSSEEYYISNSLPAILSAADLTLVEDRNYWKDIRTVCRGLKHYRRSIPTQSGQEVNVVYVDNLSFDGRKLLIINKPDNAPSFTCFDDYYRFLCSTAAKLAENSKSSVRKHRIDRLGSLSSGYDANAAAVIAKHAGCTQAVTVRQSSSYWRGSDSGEPVAKYLGITCNEYSNKAKEYPFEEAFWAVSGRAFLVNWAQFEYPEPLCLFFTGCRGDTVWDYGVQNIPDPFSVPSVGDMGMMEFRLIKGVFHCPVPFWGIRRVTEIRKISVSEEMRPWSFGGRYNRPIARRILEQAGVPRGAFAEKKKNIALAPYFLWPYSPDAVRSFRAYLRRRKLAAPPTWAVNIFRKISAIDLLLYLNITGKLGLVKGDYGIRRIFAIKGNDLLFQWGNWELKKLYEFPSEQ